MLSSSLSFLNVFFFFGSSRTCWDFTFFTLSLGDTFFQSAVKSPTNLLSFLLWVALQCFLWSPNSHNGTFAWQVRHSVKIPSVFLCMFTSFTIGVISELWFIGIIYTVEARTSSFSCWIFYPLILQFKGASSLIPEPPAFALNSLNAPACAFNLNKITLFFKKSEDQNFLANIGVKSSVLRDDSFFNIHFCWFLSLLSVLYTHNSFFVSLIYSSHKFLLKNC